MKKQDRTERILSTIDSPESGASALWHSVILQAIYDAKGNHPVLATDAKRFLVWVGLRQYEA